jgi:hypothetical protein
MLAGSAGQSGSGIRVKIIVILFLAFIVGSLFSALYFLVRDRGRGERTVRALTVRITLSVILFALLMLGYYFGFITGKL